MRHYFKKQITLIDHLLLRLWFNVVADCRFRFDLLIFLLLTFYSEDAIADTLRIHPLSQSGDLEALEKMIGSDLEVDVNS